MAASGAGDVRQQLVDSFLGWHYVDCKAVQKTTLAVINRKYLSPAIPKNSDAFEKYKDVLHSSRSMQTERAETVVLTRPYRLLIKGTTPEHVATVCDVQTMEGKAIVVLTGVHQVVEAHVVDAITLEVNRHHRQSTAPDTVQALLKENPAKLLILTSEKTIKSFVDMFENIPTATLSTAMHTAAILFTARSDAGARFRDRTSRVDANTNFYAALRTVLHSKCPFVKH